MTQKGGVRVVMRTEWRRISENLGEEYVVVEDIQCGEEIQLMVGMMEVAGQIAEDLTEWEEGDDGGLEEG